MTAGLSCSSSMGVTLNIGLAANTLQDHTTRYKLDASIFVFIGCSCYTTPRFN